MCCGVWLGKKGDAAGRGSRKIADKGLQIKVGMGNVEEDIAQEGNANRGRPCDGVRVCKRSRGRKRETERETESENAEKRHRGKVRKRLASNGAREVYRGLREGWSTRMVPKAKFGGLASL